MAKEPHKTGNDNENSKKKRKSKDNLAYGIAMGMLGGTALGSAFDDLALWIPIGVMFGVVFGNIFSDDGKWDDDRGKKHFYYEDFI